MKRVSQNGSGLLLCALLGATLFTACGSSARAQVPAATGQQTATFIDEAPHQIRQITVEPGVTLEVLDWGGAGPAMVLLTGLGDNAHVFDLFADQFTDRFRVLAITRRGFGASSYPAEGYDVDTRARDDLAVLDALGLDKAVFVGHSIAGDELSQLGASYGERVDKLVYLDAYEYGSLTKLAPLPLPDYSDRDTFSLRAFSAANARFFGSRATESSLRQTYQLDSDGQVVGTLAPAESSARIYEGSQQAEFRKIRVPVLAIFAPPGPQVPYYPYLDAAQKKEMASAYPALVGWQTDSLERFRSDVQNAEIHELPGAYHYLYITDEAFVVAKMREFLLR